MSAKHNRLSGSQEVQGCSFLRGGRIHLSLIQHIVPLFPLIPQPASLVASLCSDTDLNLPQFCSECDTIYCCIVTLYCRVAVFIIEYREPMFCPTSLLACTFGPRVAVNWRTWLRYVLADGIWTESSQNLQNFSNYLQKLEESSQVALK